MLPGLNTPTLYLWKRSLKVNHTSTLSCNCEYFRVCNLRGFFLFVLQYVSHFPLLSPNCCMSHAINCTVRHTCMCITIHTRTKQWGVSPHTCSLRASHLLRLNWNVREKEGNDRSGSGAPLTERHLCIVTVNGKSERKKTELERRGTFIWRRTNPFRVCMFAYWRLKQRQIFCSQRKVSI